MQKRSFLLWLLLASIVFGSVLAGCGGKKEEDTKQVGAPEGSNLGQKNKKGTFATPPAPPP